MKQICFLILLDRKPQMHYTVKVCMHPEWKRFIWLAQWNQMRANMKVTGGIPALRMEFKYEL